MFKNCFPPNMVHAKYNTFTVLCNYLHMLDFLIASVHLFFYILFQPSPPPKLKILKLSWLMGGQKKYSLLGVCVCMCVCIYIFTYSMWLYLYFYLKWSEYTWCVCTIIYLHLNLYMKIWISKKLIIILHSRNDFHSCNINRTA